MKTKYKLLCLLLTLLSFSCSKWVEVKPVDRLGEDQLFVNKEGYLKALNGVYVEMTNRALYGQEMTAATVDVLGQYYFMTNTQHVFLQRTTFAYTDEGVRRVFDGAWKKAYELIANCNVIIEKCGDVPSQALPQPYHGIIKGEALALRAMLHLDMLRLFGPIYSTGRTLPAIPYVSKSGFEIAPIVSAEQGMQQVTADLKSALSLMADTDPIRTEGVRNSANPVGGNDLHYRQYRLNYYATKLLLARAYLWQGNKVDALLHAEELLKEVQTPTKTVFPYVTQANATHAERPDRVFSTEVMFSLYDINRLQMYNRLFDVNLQVTSKLSFHTGTDFTRVQATYDDGNDYRRRVWQNASSGTVTALTNTKYADVVDGPGRYMIPLIKLSEALLIAAECHPDLATGTTYLNKLRTARNTFNLTPTATNLITELGKEYRREFLGEGQLFYFYKRNSFQNIPNHAVLNGEKTMVLNNYVVPLPDSEISQRN